MRPSEIEIKGKGKRRKRAAAARSCCGRIMTAKGASADKPSDPGSTGLKWAAEEQHWVPLFNTIPEVPTLNLPRAPHNSCARSRQRLCRKHCRERDVVRCSESLNWLAGRRDCFSEHDESEPTQFLLKRRMREFGNLLMNEANELWRFLFPKLLFESCWDLVLWTRREWQFGELLYCRAGVSSGNICWVPSSLRCCA